jgi:uncharacterized protein YcbX
VWDPVKGEQMYGPATGEEHDGEKVIDVGASFWSQGDFFDAAPMHFITTNTIEAFREREPDAAFDVRRFRPNVVIEVEGVDGFVENDWSVVRVGGVEFRTVMPVPRCVMTTLEQDELPRQPAVLRSAAKHNMVDTGILGKMPCAGIYATVVGEATVSAGDEVTFETA